MPQMCAAYQTSKHGPPRLTRPTKTFFAISWISKSSCCRISPCMALWHSTTQAGQNPVHRATPSGGAALTCSTSARSSTSQGDPANAINCSPGAARKRPLAAPAPAGSPVVPAAGSQGRSARAPCARGRCGLAARFILQPHCVATPVGDLASTGQCCRAEHMAFAPDIVVGRPEQPRQRLYSPLQGQDGRSGRARMYAGLQGPIPANAMTAASALWGLMAVRRPSPCACTSTHICPCMRFRGGARPLRTSCMSGPRHSGRVARQHIRSAPTSCMRAGS